MPNHIINKVHIKDREARLKALKLMKSTESKFDFNKLAPLPKELKNTTSPARIVSEAEYKKSLIENAKPEKQGDILKSYPITASMSKRFKKLFGADNWYDWQCQHWGTKWNAYDIIIHDKQVIEFQTAWSTPEIIINLLSHKLGDVEILVEYADEDFGSNCGTYTYKNGELIDQTTGDERFACDLWGYDWEEHLADKNND